MAGAQKGEKKKEKKKRFYFTELALLQGLKIEQPSCRREVYKHCIALHLGPNTSVRGSS